MEPTSSSTIQHLKGGAICAIGKSTLVLNAGIYFANNRGGGGDTLGGGMYIQVRSTFSVLPNTTVYWENNHATCGGAIFVEDLSSCNPYGPKDKCFFQLARICQALVSNLFSRTILLMMWEVVIWW